jgi:hypothetical protein
MAGSRTHRISLERKSMKIVYICKRCGSDKVRLGCFARWNPAQQQWELSETISVKWRNVFRHALCHTCEQETELIPVADYPISMVGDNARGFRVSDDGLMAYDLPVLNGRVIDDYGQFAPLDGEVIELVGWPDRMAVQIRRGSPVYVGIS